MLWSHIKSWAKDNGYTSFREKTTDPNNPNEYDYYWGKTDDPAVTGMTTSVSKLATTIYNHITNDAHVAYQKEYKEKQSQADIDHNELSSNW